MGADVVLDYREEDVVAAVKRLTGGGADVAIEALGTQQTFETALRCLRPGGTLSSLGVYSGKLGIPYDAINAGLGDHRIVTTLCPGGKERMRRLMEMVRTGRLDLTPMLTHSFSLNDIGEAYALFGERKDGVIKVAVRAVVPGRALGPGRATRENVEAHLQIVDGFIEAALHAEAALLKDHEHPLIACQHVGTKTGQSVQASRFAHFLRMRQLPMPRRCQSSLTAKAMSPSNVAGSMS